MPYSHDLIAQGGTPPYTWSVVTNINELPPGLTLDTTAPDFNNVLTGTPTEAGTFSFPDAGAGLTGQHRERDGDYHHRSVEPSDGRVPAAVSTSGPGRVLDLVIAVNELAANAVDHTAGPGWLTMWSRPREIICQVSDSGHITDPLAGSRLNVPRGHMGLWAVRRICWPAVA